MFTPRPLDTQTLKGAAEYYADQFTKPSIQSRHNKNHWIAGRAFVMQDLYNLTFKDEFQFVHDNVLTILDAQDNGDLFRQAAAGAFEPRDDDEFARLLEEHLAIRPDGTHVKGKVGKVQIGNRVVGKEERHYDTHDKKRIRDWLMFRKHGPLIERYVRMKNVYWPVYAGEPEERARDDHDLDPLPEGARAFPAEEYLALNPRISNLGARAAADAIVDRLDLGSTAAEIRGRTGSQPSGVDETETGTLLFTLPMSDPAFGAAADANPGGIATADPITDDSSADATGTLGYCRCASTGTGADDEIDGEAGTSSADFIFNTLSIVSGATVSMSSFTVTMPES